MQSLALRIWRASIRPWTQPTCLRNRGISFLDFFLFQDFVKPDKFLKDTSVLSAKILVEYIIRIIFKLIFHLFPVCTHLNIYFETSDNTDVIICIWYKQVFSNSSFIISSFFRNSHRLWAMEKALTLSSVEELISMS